MIVDSIARNAKNAKPAGTRERGFQRAPTALIGSLKGPEVSGPFVPVKREGAAKCQLRSLFG